MILEQRVSKYTIKDLDSFLHILPTQEIIDEVLSIEPLAQSYKDDLKKKIEKSKC